MPFQQGCPIVPEKVVDLLKLSMLDAYSPEHPQGHHRPTRKKSIFGMGPGSMVLLNFVP